MLVITILLQDVITALATFRVALIPMHAITMLMQVVIVDPARFQAAQI
jgi:hypothetical protein